jgi:hypothetical protein
MDEQHRPDDEPTVEVDAVTPPTEPPPGEAALPGRDPDELRERARQLHEEAGDQARAAAELRDAAAALRGEAAALLERVPELAAEAAPAREDPGAAPVGFDAPLAEPPAEASAPRRRWFRRRR